MPVDTWWLVVIVLALLGLSLMAWSLEALDVPGAVLAFVMGLVVAVVGGIPWLVLMTLFTIVGVLATAAGRARKREAGLVEDEGERSWPNVLANGSAATIAVLALLVFDPVVAVLAFTTAVAAATADTLASEVGCLSPRARCVVPPFAPMQPGRNGAVSLLGQAAAAAGALAIAAAAVPLIDLPVRLMWVPAVAGWLGCQMDSVLGATLERDAERDGPLSKQHVNFIASAVPAAVVLVVAVAA